jgi:large subunit ribosomal protein L17
MRHRNAGRTLGRNATHRLALFRNLTRALILSKNGRITTTVAKAKEVRSFVEKMITLAKKGTLHARRLAIARMGPVGNPNTDWDEKGEPIEVDVIKKLFSEIGPRFKERHGGYTRIVKLHKRRLGDAGYTAILELLKEGEKKVQKTKEAPAAQAPAPKPVAPPAPTPEQQPAATA